MASFFNYDDDTVTTRLMSMNHGDDDEEDEDLDEDVIRMVMIRTNDIAISPSCFFLLYMFEPQEATRSNSKQVLEIYPSHP